MRVVVCGGAGFIGSHLVNRLTGDGHRVVVIDNLVHGRLEHVCSAVSTGLCEFVERDITEPGLTTVMIDARPDVVVNLAGQTDVRSSVADPVHDANVNVLGTIAVLEAARRAGAQKVLLASSVAVYGPPAGLPVIEETPTNPLSPYAVSKLAAERYLHQYHQLHRLATTTLVLTNTYGPRQHPRGETGVVAVFADAMLAGRSTRVFGDGGNTRDYVFVEDVADAFVRACHPVSAGLRLNIGTGVATTDLALNRAVARAVGGAPEPEFAPARLGDVPHMRVDATAARRILGWQPRVDIRTGIYRTVAAMRELSAPMRRSGS